MANPDSTARPLRVNRRYLIDRPSQLRFSLIVLLVVSGVGLLYAVAIYFIAGSTLMSGRSPDQIRAVLLLVHVAYFVICGTLLFLTVLLLTHRFVGPAYVMRMAVEKMRRGDYSGRLSLRVNDFHAGLAEEIGTWREEVSAQDDARMETLAQLQRCMDEGDDAGARGLVAQLLSDHSVGPVEPAAVIGARAVV